MVQFKRKMFGAVVCLFVAVVTTGVIFEAGLVSGTTRSGKPAVAVSLNDRFSRSVVDDRVRAATVFDADQLSSPGIMFAQTPWENQQINSHGYQVAKNSGADIVHFVWTHFRDAPMVPYRTIQYSSYTISSGVWNQGFGGTTLRPDELLRSGYVNLAVDSENRAHIAYHRYANEYESWYEPQYADFPTAGSDAATHVSLTIPSPLSELLWTRMDVQQNDSEAGQSGPDVVHVIARAALYYDTSEVIVYWRLAGAGWEGPVIIDSSSTVGHVLAADPNSDRVTVVLHSEYPWDGMNGLRNVAYHESQTEGAGWIDGSELGPGSRHFITHYDDSSGPQAWVHISTAYDHDNVLHVIWDEQRQAGTSEHIAIRHWNSTRGTIRTAAYGYWDNPYPSGFTDRNLAKMTLGIGDGSTTCTGGPGDQSNRDYLYVLYTQFGGPTPEEQADYSTGGYMNGELYLTVSNDGGSSWSVPANLTNTKTPGCEPYEPVGDCASEHWATIAKTVDDINIFYILDLDAGISLFEEGRGTMNPVMYLRLPGGGVDAPYLCPDSMISCVCPCHGDPECDGVSDILDLVRCVDVAFREGPPISGGLCPFLWTDLNCDDLTNVLDIVRMVNVVFREADPLTEWCAECPPQAGGG